MAQRWPKGMFDVCYAPRVVETNNTFLLALESASVSDLSLETQMANLRGCCRPTRATTTKVRGAEPRYCAVNRMTATALIVSQSVASAGASVLGNRFEQLLRCHRRALAGPKRANDGRPRKGSFLGFLRAARVFLTNRCRWTRAPPMDEFMATCGLPPNCQPRPFLGTAMLRSANGDCCRRCCRWRTTA